MTISKLAEQSIEEVLKQYDERVTSSIEYFQNILVTIEPGTRLYEHTKMKMEEEKEICANIRQVIVDNFSDQSQKEIISAMLR